jgi:hypothetical protein
MQDVQRVQVPETFQDLQTNSSDYPLIESFRELLYIREHTPVAELKKEVVILGRFFLIYKVYDVGMPRFFKMPYLAPKIFESSVFFQFSDRHFLTREDPASVRLHSFEDCPVLTFTYLLQQLVVVILSLCSLKSNVL